jgi:hypothetical protein
MPYPTDLTTLARAANYITPGLSGQALNAATPVLALQISACSNTIQRYLARQLPALGRSELRNGQGRPSIRTLVTPIIEISQLQISAIGGSEAWSIIPPANGQGGWGYTNDSWFINLQPGWFGSYFPVGKQNVQITYTAGFVTPGMIALNTLSSWVALTPTIAGTQIQNAGYYYLAVTAGATGATAPAWSTVTNSLTTDGSPAIAWMCQGAVPVLPAGASYIPEDIELSCLELVSLTYKNQTRVGDTGTGVGPDRVNYMLAAMPKPTMERLNRHREVFPVDGAGTQ